MPFRAAVANEWPGTFVTNYFLEIIAVGIALLAQSTITITPIAAGLDFYILCNTSTRQLQTPLLGRYAVFGKCKLIFFI